MLMLLPLVFVAQAGTGPWVLSPGDLSAYGGAEAQRIGHLAVSDGSRADSVVEVDDGLTKVGAVADLSLGLLPGVEVQAAVPFYRVVANRRDGPICAALGEEACRTTDGLGVVSLRAKGLVLDELRGRPLSAALGGELRLGSHQLDVRERLTNLGEGTNDVGAFLAVGRSGAVGGAYYSGHLDLLGRYRLPITEVDGTAVPGWETVVDAEALVGGARWLVGPTVNVLWRPDGVDFEAADLADDDRFSSLSVVSARAGGKLLLRGSERVTFSLSVLGTAWAVNNPSDLLSVSAGVGLYQPKRADRP